MYSQPYSAEECSHLLPAQQPGGAADPLPEILDLGGIFPQELAADDIAAWGIPWDQTALAEQEAGRTVSGPPATYPLFSEAAEDEEENYGLAAEDQEKLLIHLLQVAEREIY